MPGPLTRLALLSVILLLTGCAAADVADDPASPVPSPPASTAAPSPVPAPPSGKPTDPKLRKELLAMLAADQKDRQSGADPGAGAARDRARTDRLREIVARHGWPTRTMVGRDGATAAWAITQHSDLDPAFQQEMLELLRRAAEVGEASRGDLAYLTDRVAAGAGRPQTYGTQMGCGPDGKPQLAPLAEPDRVDQLRAEAGLPTLEEYLAELAEVCAEPP